MKSFGTDHTPRSHITKSERKLSKMDIFYLVSDSLVLAENELKKAFWNCISALEDIKIYFGAKGEKIFISAWAGAKKNLTQEVEKKIFFSEDSCTILIFFYLDSINYVYLKWFISIETSSRYICSIFKTRDNFFQYILILKFVTIKDDWTKYRHC